MEHKDQLPICALQYRFMNEKLNEIGADVKQLVEDKSKQAAINMQVLRAIEDINRKNEEQESYLANLKFFAWLGANWKEVIASLLAFGGLVVAYLALKK